MRRLGRLLSRVLRQVAPCLEPSQGGTGAAQPGHERSDWDPQGVGSLLVGQALDGHEMQGGALLVRQAA